MGKRSSGSMMRMLLGVGASCAVSTLILTVFCVERAEAIAAFSRELKTECTTCHTIFPQLNEFGQAFEKNGFVWPGGVAKSKKVRVTQTEEERKSAEFIKLSGIPVVLPLAASLSASYLYDDTKEDDFDMKRFGAEIFAAGAFGGDRVGFWFNERLGSQSGGPTGPSQVWFVARHPLGVPVHLKAGRLSPDLSLWKSTLNGRMMSAGYFADGFSWSGAQSGLELSAFLGPRVLAVVGMNDRNNSTAKAGPSTVNDKGEFVPGKPAETHSVNDFYGRLAVKFGGADYHGTEPDIDLDKDSVWDYLSVSFGAFGYSGSTSKGDGFDHDLTRIGLEAEASYKKALLMLGATFGQNNAESDDPLKSTALSAEIDYVFNPMFALALRYDVLDIDGKDKQTRISPGVIYAPLQSFKLRLNATIDSNPTGAAPGKADANTTAILSAILSF
ncbi:MAG: hypothetical protein ACYC9Y_07950 [Candidatus Methylomirabilia bacterium]